MGKENVTESFTGDLEMVKASAERLEGLLRRGCVRGAETGQKTGTHTLERFAAELAAYFKDLLDDVSACGRILQSALDRTDPLRQHALSIVARAEAGKTISAKLLALSNERMVKPSLIYINHFVRELAHLVSGVVKKRVSVRTDLAEQDMPVMADRVKLGQVFVSLIRHASLFSADGDTMTVRTGIVPVESGLLAGSPGCALLSIRSAHRRPSRSEIELAGKAETKCARLGFSVIRRIVEEHRGAFRIGGRRGESVEYNIYLPVATGFLPAL